MYMCPVKMGNILIPQKKTKMPLCPRSLLPSVKACPRDYYKVNPKELQTVVDLHLENWLIHGNAEIVGQGWRTEICIKQSVSLYVHAPICSSVFNWG